MKKARSQLKTESKFRYGTSGACEARLYEFLGTYGVGTDDEAELRRIAAANVHEGLVYLQQWEPEFDVKSVQCVGMMILLSGSPLD
jgi:hypothetical protein